MNNKYRILIVEDEKNITQLVTTLLETNGYQVISAENCNNGIMLFLSHNPDLIILDLGLPDADGMELLKKVRQTSLVPVIVLSARSDERDKVEALDLGANDYVTKPFGYEELVARVRSALRNSKIIMNDGNVSSGKFKAKGLVIDYGARRVFVDGNEVKFTQTEYNILALLSGYPGKVMTYSAIIREIWGYNDLNSTKKLQVNMANIRKKLGAKPGGNNFIENELGVGYRMCEQTE